MIRLSVIKWSLVLIACLCWSHVNAQDITGGEVIGRNIYGLAIDYQADPVLLNDRPLIYKSSQFNETIKHGDASFMISAFSDSIGGVYITRLEAKTGRLLDTLALDLSSIDGLSSPTSGSKTLWNTFMLSENGLAHNTDPKEFITRFKPYYKGKSNLVNAYNYGWISEVIILDDKGQAKAIKNYAMGRVFAKQVIIMPDGKTVYMLDSLGNLYLFIAEQAESLVKGELYAVSRQQGKINFTLLGKTSALKVKFKLKNADFESIFQTSKPKKQSCKKKFTYINTIFGEECLKLKSKFKKYAAFFEPIRMRALQGIPRFVIENSSMEFDAASKKIIFEQTDQENIILTVGENSNLDSQFIIKEPL